MELFFIGVGGGRAATDTQVFPTGGFRVHCSNFKMHVDPGPGALARSIAYKQQPQKLDAIFCSHSHIDHTNDLNVLVEAMNFDKSFKQGEQAKRGALYCSKSIAEKSADFEQALQEYFKRMLQKLQVMKAGDAAKISEGVTLRATRTDHEDKSGIGFVLDDGSAKLGYSADTQLFEGFTDQFEGVDALVLNVLRTADKPFPYHLCIDQAAQAVKQMRKPPSLVFIYHLGLLYIQAGTKSQAQRFTKLSGVPALIAQEGQTHQITGEEQGAKQRKKLTEY